MAYVLVLKFTVYETSTFADEEALYRLGDKVASEIVPPEGADLWYEGCELLKRNHV